MRRPPLRPIPPLAEKVIEVGKSLEGGVVKQSWGGDPWDIAYVNMFYPEWPHGDLSPQLMFVWWMKRNWEFSRCSFYDGPTPTIIRDEAEALDLLYKFKETYG